MVFIVIGICLIVFIAVPLAILLLRASEEAKKGVLKVGAGPAVIEHETNEPLPSADMEDDEEECEPGATAESIVLQCPRCGQANRVPIGSGSSTAYRCARCKEALPKFNP